jgi:hypothetical protein
MRNKRGVHTEFWKFFLICRFIGPIASDCADCAARVTRRLRRQSRQLPKTEKSGFFMYWGCIAAERGRAKKGPKRMGAARAKDKNPRRNGRGAHYLACFFSESMSMIF